MSLVACLFALLSQQIDLPLAYSVNGAWQPITVQGASFLPSQLTITGHVDSIWQLVVENTSPNIVGAVFGDSPWYDNDAPCFAGIRLRGSGGEFLSTSASLPTTVFRLGPYDGTLDFGGISGHTTAWLRTTRPISLVVTDPAVLALFAGSDPVQIEVERFGYGFFASSNAGNFVQGAFSKVAASLELTFEP